MKAVFITSIGSFLPNHPIANDEMEDYLGKIHGINSVAKSRILAQNGILQRYYALDLDQQTTHSNTQLAAQAISKAVDRIHVLPENIQLLVTGTTQGDLLVPGFASMVHAELGWPACEIASFQSICVSSIMALKHAYLQIKCGECNLAVIVGSELNSRWLKASRFETQDLELYSFKAEALRWLLSDGAGACVLADQPRKREPSLKVQWIEWKSHVIEYQLGVYAGTVNYRDDLPLTWQDYKDIAEAAHDGAMNLKQGDWPFEQVLQTGIDHYLELIKKGKIIPDQIDWVCCHYTSDSLKQSIKNNLERLGIDIEDQKWFSNLSTKGNTGAAAIFITLEELMYSRKLKNGDHILCMVPESGRLMTAFIMLEVVK